jgi:hypothetical protein
MRQLNNKMFVKSAKSITNGFPKKRKPLRTQHNIVAGSQDAAKEVLENEQEADKSFDSFVQKEKDIEKTENGIEMEENEIDEEQVKQEQENTCKLTVIQNIGSQLEAAGMKDYFISKNGGCRTAMFCKTVQTRVSTFLSWSFHHHNHYCSSLEPNKAIEWLSRVINEHYDIISLFADHLSKERLISSSTIVNYLADLNAGFQWFVMFRKDRKTVFPLTPDSLRPVDMVLKNIRRYICPLVRKEKAKSLSVHFLIRNKKIPVGGLPALANQLLSEMDWVKSFEMTTSSVLNNKVIVKETYNKFMQILYCALYVFASQGRIGGIETLTLSQAEELLQDGFTATDTFKTSAVYGLQPVTLAKFSGPVFQLYITVFRPIAASKRVKSNFDSPLWLTFEGNGDLTMG